MLSSHGGDVRLFSIIITVLIVVVGGIFTILCCWLKKKKEENIEEDGDSKALIVNPGDIEESYKDNKIQPHHQVYGSTSSTGKSPTGDPEDIEKNITMESSLQEQPDSVKEEDVTVKNKKKQTDDENLTVKEKRSDPVLMDGFNEIKELEDSKEELAANSTSSGHSDSVISTDETDLEVLREKELKKEKEDADSFSRQHFSNDSLENVADIGSRLQKYWYQINCAEKRMLQITVKISAKCPLELGTREVDVLKELIKYLQHPYLLPVYDVACNDKFIGLVVEFVESGSLRDRIHSVRSPLDDWKAKYSTNSVSLLLPVKEVSICGRHVLEAVLLLYNHGLQSIGQIQSGNIFKIGDRYVLGGYENILLGYRSSLYDDIKDAEYLKIIDVIMFGVMIYEMATGISKVTHIPLNESDMENVNDDRLKEVLHYIFSNLKSVKNQKEAMLKILNHRFFNLAEKTANMEPFELPTEGFGLISAVRAQESGETNEKFTVKDLNVDSIQKRLPQSCTVLTSWQQIGWRCRKAVAKAESLKFKCSCLVTAIEVPHTCPIYVEPSLDSILELLKLKHLLVTYDVQYMKVDQAHIIVLFQKYFKHGSLKDQLYNTSPLKPWHEKYEGERRTMSDDEIARIGSQILNIATSLCYMDRKQNPLKLRFLHSGNIFMDGDHCVIGGLENMLLGCRPRHYVKFRDHLSCIDTVMFGHLVFELATGRELSTAIPTSEDYSLLSDPIQHLLKTIFENLKMDFKEISSLDFFKSHDESCQVVPSSFKRNVKKLLKKVRKEKKRNQAGKKS